MKNFKAVKPNLAESYNRLFGSTHRNLLTEAYARDAKDGKTLDKYFDELVPSSGQAGTVNGEIVRAANRIGYRWYNDGDKFYDGYGTETAGPAMAFLTKHNEIDPQIRDAFKRIERAAVGTSSDKEYEKFLEELFTLAVRHVEMIPNSKTNVDLFDYDSDYEDEEDEEDDDPWGYDDDEDEEDFDY
jgi:hypothetical protein